MVNGKPGKIEFCKPDPTPRTRLSQNHAMPFKFIARHKALDTSAEH